MSRRSSRRSTRHKPRHTRSKGRAFRRLLRIMRTQDRDDVVWPIVPMLTVWRIAATTAAVSNGSSVSRKRRTGSRAGAICSLS